MQLTTHPFAHSFYSSCRPFALSVLHIPRFETYWNLSCTFYTYLNRFVKESQKHGWPSFRDEEVNWDHVRCLRDGECVSETGTHLGHNIPDRTGNRYCINLVSVAGNPNE